MIGAGIVSLLDSALNTPRTSPDRKVLVRPLIGEYDGSSYATVIVNATVSDSLDIQGGVSGVYEGRILVGISTADFQTAEVVGDTIRETLNGYSGMLGTQYDILSIIVSPETSARDEDDSVTGITQTYEAQWVKLGEV